MLGFMTEVFFLVFAFGAGWFGHALHLRKKRKIAQLLKGKSHA